MKCYDDCQEYVKRKCTEFQDYSVEYRMHDALFSTFNHLSTYFPEVYEHMLKVWEGNYVYVEISTENDLNSIKDYTENEHAL